jgi:putative membrane protein
MKRLLLFGSALALLTGCASDRNATYRGTTGTLGAGTDAGYGIGVAPTQQGAGAVQLTTSQLNSDESRFLQRAAEYNQTDIQLGQSIVQKSDAPELKSFGQRLVDDHTLANQQLQAFIAQTGVSVSMAPNADQQQMLDRLNGLGGADFDRAATHDAESLEQRQVNLDTAAANKCQNPDLRNYAQQSLRMNQDELTQCGGLVAPAPTVAPVSPAPSVVPVPSTTPGPGVSPRQPSVTPPVVPVPPATAGPGVSQQQPTPVVPTPTTGSGPGVSPQQPQQP